MITIKQPLCFCEKGNKPNQEDSLYPVMGAATADNRVFLVCDGMGGHADGEVASKCVADAVGQITASKSPCSMQEMRQIIDQEALPEAYKQLALHDDLQSTKRMGTTMTFVAFCTDGVLLAHIGDSRIYHLRPGRGILYHTRDHSLVNDLVAAGEITEEEARVHPRRNVITRALQPIREDDEDALMMKATYRTVTDLEDGDIFFMCCDGVIEQIDDAELGSILLSDKPTAERVETLKRRCAELNTRDNNTCYFLEIESVGDMICTFDEVDVQQVEMSRPAAPYNALPPQQKNNSLVMIIAIVVVAMLCGAALFFFTRKEDKADEQQMHKNNLEQVIHEKANDIGATAPIAPPKAKEQPDPKKTQPEKKTAEAGKKSAEPEKKTAESEKPAKEDKKESVLNKLNSKIADNSESKKVEVNKSESNKQDEQ